MICRVECCPKCSWTDLLLVSQYDLGLWLGWLHLYRFAVHITNQFISILQSWSAGTILKQPVYTVCFMANQNHSHVQNIYLDYIFMNQFILSTILWFKYKENVSWNKITIRLDEYYYTIIVDDFQCKSLDS